MNTCGSTPPTATNTSPSSWTSLPYVTVVVPPGSWTGSRADPSGSSKPGWPPSPTPGARTLRSSRWMDSPGLRAPPLKNSPMQGRSWIPSTSCTWLATPWMSAAGAFSKNFTIGAGGPRIPCTRLAVCSTPGHACSLHAPHPVMPAHPMPATPASRPVRQRLPRRPRGHMDCLPEHYRCLPRS